VLGAGRAWILAQPDQSIALRGLSSCDIRAVRLPGRSLVFPRIGRRSLDMKPNPFRVLLATLLVAATVVACDDNPVAPPANRRPTILSLTVFPGDIASTDSAIVICNAMDPDADTLAYDWITDGRLNIKGAVSGQHFLYNTYSNSIIIFPNVVNSPIDTAWMQCYARDRKGMSDNRKVYLVIRQ